MFLLAWARSRRVAPGRGRVAAAVRTRSARFGSHQDGFPMSTDAVFLRREDEGLSGTPPQVKSVACQAQREGAGTDSCVPDSPFESPCLMCAERAERLLDSSRSFWRRATASLVSSEGGAGAWQRRTCPPRLGTQSGPELSHVETGGAGRRCRQGEVVDGRPTSTFDSSPQSTLTMSVDI